MLPLLHTLSAGSAFFLTFIILTDPRQTNVPANRWMAVFVFSIGISILDDSLFHYKLYREYPYLYSAPGLFILLIMPALYMSVVHYVSVNRRFQWMDLWYFSFFILIFLLNAPFLFFAPLELRLKLIQEDDAITQLDTFSFIMLGLMLLQSVVFWGLALQKILLHRVRVQLITAAPETVRLDWLLYLLIGVGGMTLVWAVDMFNFAADAPGDATLAPGYFVGIFFLGYHLLRQNEVYPYKGPVMEEIRELIEAPAAPQSTGKRLYFEGSELDSMKQMLIDFMETHKPFLNNELSLPMLADSLKLRTHELSQLINEGFGENFNGFINRFRIEESKRMLLDPAYSHLNIAGIAFEAGFNSRTVFNTTFKKQTGISPTEFQKQKEVVEG